MGRWKKKDGKGRDRPREPGWRWRGKVAGQRGRESGCRLVPGCGWGSLEAMGTAGRGPWGRGHKGLRGCWPRRGEAEALFSVPTTHILHASSCPRDAGPGRAPPKRQQHGQEGSGGSWSGDKNAVWLGAGRLGWPRQAQRVLPCAPWAIKHTERPSWPPGAGIEAARLAGRGGGGEPGHRASLLLGAAPPAAGTPPLGVFPPAWGQRALQQASKPEQSWV